MTLRVLSRVATCLILCSWCYARPCVNFQDLIIVKNGSPEIVAAYLLKWQGAINQAIRQETAALILTEYAEWFPDRPELGLLEFAEIQARPPAMQRTCRE